MTVLYMVLRLRILGAGRRRLRPPGVDPDEARRTVRWSKPRILAASHPRSAAMRLLWAAARSEFGSWEAACEAARITI